MTEPRYTLDEARRVIAQADCAYVGHQPAHYVRPLADPYGHYLCDCGHITWRPEPKETT